MLRILAIAFNWVFPFGGLRLANISMRKGIVTRKIFGYTIFLPVQRSSAHKLLALEGRRFMHERNIVRKVIGRGDTVIDCGANIGYYALLFSRIVGKEGEVVCLEPDSNNLAELYNNIESNKIENITIVECAAGANDGETILEPGLNAQVAPDELKGVAVKLYKIDTIVDNLRIKKVDFIKIDVEGYEGEVLRGMKKTILSCSPSILIEVHPGMIVDTSDLKSTLIRLYSHYGTCRIYDPLSGGFIQKIRRRVFGFVLGDSSCDFESYLDLVLNKKPRKPYFILFTQKQLG